MIKPQAITYQCSQCGWTHTLTPNSDVLVQPSPEKCPQCGHQPLNHHKASLLEEAAAKLKALWGA